MLLALQGNKLKCHAIYANLCEISHVSKVGLPRLLLLSLCSVSVLICSDRAKYSATKRLQAAQLHSFQLPGGAGGGNGDKIINGSGKS